MAEAMKNSAYSDAETDAYLDIGLLRKQYLDHCNVKRQEIEEQRTARKYYHFSHWTEDELKKLKHRRQPPFTTPLLTKKINSIVGLTERLKQDPKAYPRTPEHEAGAEIATAALRYALDNVQWDELRAEEDLGAAIEGIGGVEMSLVYNNEDQSDAEIELAPVDTDTFFYDPRSFRPDFSDARFMGVAKWMDKDAAKEMFPDHADEIDGLMGGSQTNESYAQQDRERKWVDSENERVFLIEHWYRHEGSWCFCFYIASLKLLEGKTPFVDEHKQGISRFIMYSANVDQDGDRYGFVRGLKSPTDEINYRTSKALHQLNSRRVIAEKGAVDDIEKARLEYAREDGWVERNPGLEITPDDAKKQADFVGQLQLLQEAKGTVDSFGPNPQLMGETRGEKSGRAINLLQQAGLAELGPFIVAQRGWKIRVYRAVWGAITRYWTTERWIRVTDNEGLAQFIRINGLTVGPDGRPALENAIGSLDVDIILDEGPDTINVMEETYRTLEMLAQSGAPIPPQVLIKASPLESSKKKELLDTLEKAAQQPPPEVAAKQAELEFKAKDREMQFEADERDRQATFQLKVREQNMDFFHEARKLQLNADNDRFEAINGVITQRMQDMGEGGVLTIVQGGSGGDKALETVSEGLKAVGDGLSRMAEAQAVLAQAVTAPKRIALTRDENGRPDGAVQVAVNQ